jgi:two-component system sensor histidine kinase KdpD
MSAQSTKPSRLTRADDTRSRSTAASVANFRLREYLLATAGVAVAGGVAFAFAQLPLANLSLVFLAGVLFVASRWGFGPAIYASLLSFLVFNFVFTPPFYTFRVHKEGDFATLLLFLAMAALTGHLAARMRAAIARNEATLKRISNLHEYTRRVAAAADGESVSQALADHVAETLDSPAVTLIPDKGGKFQLHASTRPSQPSARLDEALAERVLRHNISETKRDGWWFLPLATAARRVGLLGIYKPAATAEQQELIRALCDQAAVALERVFLVDDLEQAHVAAETEQLRSALLSSVSHDLRTPLSSIIGAATSLMEYGEHVGAANRRELAQTVRDEAERLNRYIQNLLDMTRLGRGGLTLRRDWVDLHDIVATATERLGSMLQGHALRVGIAPEVALLNVHGVLIEQAFINLLENAARFSPPGTRIDVLARREGERVLIEVIDRGPGIAEADRERVFDMFYSVRVGDRGTPGTGLGLAICRGLIGAHGGEISARTGPDGTGTCMRISLPASCADHDNEVPPA